MIQKQTQGESQSVSQPSTSRSQMNPGTLINPITNSEVLNNADIFYNEIFNDNSASISDLSSDVEELLTSK